MKRAFWMIMMVLLVGCGGELVEKDAGDLSESVEIKPIKLESKSLLDSNFHHSPMLVNLSDSFHFQITTLRIPIANYLDSCIINIIISDKTSLLPIDTVTFTSLFFSEEGEGEENNVYSFQTGFGGDFSIFDWYDLVVADFNFDGLDDFATQNGSGGSLGACYNFYIQAVGKKWETVPYLNDSVSFCPLFFDKEQKTFQTRIMEGIKGIVVRTYRYFPMESKWRKIKEQRPNSGQFNNLVRGYEFKED